MQVVILMLVWSPAAPWAALTAGVGRDRPSVRDQPAAGGRGHSRSGLRVAPAMPVVEEYCACRESAVLHPLSAELSTLLALPLRPTYSANEMLSNHLVTNGGTKRMDLQLANRVRHVIEGAMQPLHTQ